jgi:hypothetical protein
VTDESTGQPVGGCGVSFGQFYTISDAAGHFVIKGRESWEEMRVIAAGYEPKSVPVDASDTRYPVVYIQLTPRLKAGPGSGGRSSEVRLGAGSRSSG